MKLVLALALSVLALAACSKSSTGASSSAGSTHVTVFAASSLTGAFTEIGKQYEAANPGAKVVFSFGPSDGLAQQIDQGAPADVFASASTTWMDDVSKNGPGISDEANFAQNKLVVITPLDNPADIGSFEDLGNPGVKLVVAAEGVPAGDYAREALKSAGIAKAAEANIVSNEQDDAAVVQKVASGEADAGIVYVSDVSSMSGANVKAVEIPGDVNVIATYPIAVVAGSASSAEASRFVSYVTGPEGQKVLHEFGFLLAPG